jgi:hypothetical protein
MRLDSMMAKGERAKGRKHGLYRQNTEVRKRCQRLLSKPTRDPHAKRTTEYANAGANLSFLLDCEFVFQSALMNASKFHWHSDPAS